MWRLHCKRKRRARPGAHGDRARRGRIHPLTPGGCWGATHRTTPQPAQGLPCSPMVRPTAHARLAPCPRHRWWELQDGFACSRASPWQSQDGGYPGEWHQDHPPPGGDRPTSSLLLAVESQVVFLGFRSGTHSPPRSKVITDWMELSGGRRKS